MRAAAAAVVVAVVVVAVAAAWAVQVAVSPSRKVETTDATTALSTTRRGMFDMAKPIAIAIAMAIATLAAGLAAAEGLVAAQTRLESAPPSSAAEGEGLTTRMSKR